MEPSTTISRFARRLDGHYRWWSVARAVSGHGLVLAVVLCIAELALPGWLLFTAWPAVAWLIGVGVWTASRAKIPVARADRQLGLRDRLLTYTGLPGDVASRGGFASWLRLDLEQLLSRVPAEEVARVWRRPLGALRYLVPLLVILVLLRVFAPLPPAWPALVGPTMTSGGGGQGHGDGGGSESEQQSSDEANEQEDPDETPAGEDEQPPDSGVEEGDEEPPPPPDLQAKVIDELVIPRFVGEGETRKVMTNVAVIERGADPQPQASAQSPQPPPADETDVEAAYEQALRTRNVPPQERPFVKAYFERLLEAVK